MRSVGFGVGASASKSGHVSGSLKSASLAGIAVVLQANVGGSGLAPSSCHRRTTVVNAIRPGCSPS